MHYSPRYRNTNTVMSSACGASERAQRFKQPFQERLGFQVPVRGHPCDHPVPAEFLIARVRRIGHTIAA